MPDEAKQWVAVTVLVLCDDTLLSMQRGSSQKTGAGLWEGISGRVRPGEEPHVAASREVVEESGLRVEIAQRPIATYAALRGGDPMTVIVFRGAFIEGEVRLSKEHDAYRWVTAAEFEALGAPAQLVQIARELLSDGADV